MPQRLRFLTGLIVFLAASSTLGVQGSAGASSPALTLSYTGTLAVILADGTQIQTSRAPGAVISPGTYQVAVVDNFPDTNDPVHMFHLSGPGVNLMTDLVGGDDKAQLFVETLQPSSIYTFQDDLQPGPAVVFSTSSTTSSSSGSGSSGSGAVGGSSAGSSSGTSANSGVVGSLAKPDPFRGSLTATVSPAGALTLAVHGKAVSTLKAGRYRISVLDRSTTRGFVVQEIRKAANILTAGPFVGKRSETVDLKRGQWFFYPTVVGKKTYFIVT